MRIPEIDGLYVEPLQTLLAGDGDIFGISAETKAASWILDAAELGRKEDVVSFLWV